METIMIIALVIIVVFIGYQISTLSEIREMPGCTQLREELINLEAGDGIEYLKKKYGENWRKKLTITELHFVEILENNGKSDEDIKQRAMGYFEVTNWKEIK